MKKLKLFIAISAAIFAQMVVHAQLMTGYLGFTGVATLNSNSAGTATAVTSWSNLQPYGFGGIFATGPYAILSSDSVTFISQAWNFNTTIPITNFWNVDGFKFELLSSEIVLQGGTPPYGYTAVNGWGVLSANGFTPTVCTWSFTISDPPANETVPSWTFAANVDCSNTNGEPVLASTTISNTTVLSWPDPTFGLQSAPTPNGTFTNIPNATSPYTNQITGNQQYFRLLQP